ILSLSTSIETMLRMSAEWTHTPSTARTPAAPNPAPATSLSQKFQQRRSESRRTIGHLLALSTSESPLVYDTIHIVATEESNRLLRLGNIPSMPRSRRHRSQ